MKKQIYVIHGYGASPDKHWFPWLKRILGNKGYEIEILKMPTPETPKVNEWIAKLKKDIEIINENTEIDNDAVFLYEGNYLDKFLPYTDEIICYFWNRDYPFDETFEEHLKNIWKEKEKVEFKGKSHDEITRIRYVKED